MTRTEKVDENSSMDYFLGEKPVTKTTDNKILVRDIVNNIENIQTNTVARTISSSA